MLQERFFKNGKFRLWRGRLQQPFSQQASVGVPEVGQMDHLIARFGHRYGKELSGSAGAKLYCRQPVLLPGVNHHRLCMRSRQHRATLPVDPFAPRTFINSELVLGKVHHQVRLPVGHDSLQPEGEIRLVIVKRFYEPPQNRRSGLRSKGIHGGQLSTKLHG